MFKNIRALRASEYLYYLIVVFAFTLPLSRAALSFFALMLPLVWIFDKNIKQKILMIKNSPALMAIIFFLCVQALSIFYTQDQALGWNGVRLYAYWIILFVIVTSIKKEQISSLVSAFLYGMFVSEVCAYIIFFDIYPINGHSSSYPNPFMHHILYSVFLALSAALLLNRLFSKRYTPYEKVFIFVFFLTVTINLFISTGRTGQLAFFVAIFVVTALHLKLSIRSIVVATLLSTTLFYSAYKLLPQVQQRFDAAQSDIVKVLNNDFSSSWGIRLAYWLISYEILKDDPLLGVGIGDYKKAAQEVLTNNPYNFTPEVIAFCSRYHFHNQYLMIAVQTGIIGIIAMLYLLYQLLRLKSQTNESKEIKAIFLSVILVGFIAEPLWIKQFTLMLFLFFTALLLVGSDQIKQIQTLNEKE